MSKYEPLSERLRTHGDDEWRTSFSDLEQVLGFQLPKTARSSRKWWANDPEKGHSRSWAGAGWEVGDIDPAAETVIFRRGAASAAVIQKVAHLEPLQEGARVEAPQPTPAPAPPAAMEGAAPASQVAPPESTQELDALDEAEEAARRAKRTRQLGMGALVASAAAVVAGIGLGIRAVLRRR